MVKYGEVLKYKTDPKRDVHNYSYEEIVEKYTYWVEGAKFESSALIIQRWIRLKLQRVRFLKMFAQRNKAAFKVQKGWRRHEQKRGMS
jgi:hypothetical protein